MNEFENPHWEEEEVEIEAIGIEVDVQPIELYKVLKIANVVSGGGEAKFAIADGYVAVNGELEMRKRRKLYDGDLVEFNQEYYLIICDAPVTEAEAKPKAKPAPQPKAKKAAAKPSNAKTAGDKKGAKAASQKAKSNNKKAGLSQTASKNKPVADEPRPSANAEGGRSAIKFF